jgi:hypothetical protein
MELIEQVNILFIFIFFILYSSRHHLIQLYNSPDTPVVEKLIIKKKTMKYEDKYLETLQNIPNEYFFTDDEKRIENQKYQELLATQINTEATEKIKLDIGMYQQELSDIDDFECPVSHELKRVELTEKIQKLQNELKITQENAAQFQAKQYIIDMIHDRLANCIVMENTPIGNAIMLYNAKRETFEYYSDCSIPYRYLETICRKYVTTYKCKPLYIDMDAELKESKKRKDEKEEKEKEKEKEKANEKKTIIEPKKNVFAKFKSYNNSGTGKINTGAPPKNSSHKMDTNQKNENVILKDNANRYSYQGKINNFSVLKKIDKKLVNKKYNMSFADFKKQLLQKNIINIGFFS